MIAQVCWAGYQLGVGNQSIQIAFLKSLHNPNLYSNDEMVGQTLGEYPSAFYASLAPLLSFCSLPNLYLAMHLIATAGLFIAVTWLARSIFRDHWTGLAVVVILMAGHHQALAGEQLYSPGFTHTWAVFAVNIAALALFYQEMYLAAFALLGVAFNLHALEAGQLALMLGFAAICEIRRHNWRQIAVALAILLLAALPALVMMFQKRQDWSEPWLSLMRVRSADHSFPSSWWESGNRDIPRFATLLGLAAVAMGFPPARSRQRKTLWIVAAASLLFVIGYVFTEIWPWALAVRGQFFRASRFVAILALLFIAHGAVRAFVLPWRRDSAPLSDKTTSKNAMPSLAAWRAWLEFALAAATIAVLAAPWLMPFLPLVLILAIAVAIINRRLGWHQAIVAGAAMFVCILSWREINFLLPALSKDFSWSAALGFNHAVWSNAPATMLFGWLALVLGATLWWLAVQGVKRWRVLMIWATTIAALAAFLAVMVPRWVDQKVDDPRMAGWIDIQKWAKANTPVASLILVPAEPGMFRTYSERSVVGEWRDGTQLYFSAGFAQPWEKRMVDLGLINPRNKHRMNNRDAVLPQLSDEEIIKKCRRYGADYVVLPSERKRRLERVYQNGVWAVYRPLTPNMKGDATSDVASNKSDAFIQQMAEPNIEKYRQSNVKIQVVDASGRPVDGQFEVQQVSSPFLFGASLPFFKPHNLPNDGDFKPPVVTEPERHKFLEVFNSSMITFSGWWMFLEPQEGKRDYADLDAYVDWATANNIQLDFNFLSGHQPRWVKLKSPAEQQRLFVQHAMDLVARYKNRIKSWQVVDEKMLLDLSPAVFVAIRQAQPQVKLGIADATRFFAPPNCPYPEIYLQRGMDDVQKLRDKEIAVDYFGLHGNRPIGLWPNPWQIYEVLDAFAEAGITVRVTAAGFPLDMPIEGSNHVGETWTPQAQAEAYEQFLTVCFSHPAVEGVNFCGIGPETWIRGAGFLDDKYQPTPAFQIIKDLITERWRTNDKGRVSLDGWINFRGYHGAYELTVTPTGGSPVHARFTVLPGDSETRLKLDKDAGILTTIPAEPGDTP